MDLKSTLAPYLTRESLRKFLLVAVVPVVVYMLKNLLDKLLMGGKKKNKGEISVEQIRKMIEELPFDTKNFDSNMSLKDLLHELKEVGRDDDEWRKLIESAENFYKNEEANQ